MSQQIPDLLTPLDRDTAAKALADGYQSITGKKPSAKVLKLIIAQSALESGNWKFIHNFNYGNEKASSSDEFIQRYTVGDDPTDPGAFYAAFKNPSAGAEHYIKTLLRRDHWRKGLESGVASTFVAALSTPPVYFTADPTRYLNTLAKLVDEYAPEAKKYGVSLLGTFLGVALLGSLTFVFVTMVKK